MYCASAAKSRSGRLLCDMLKGTIPVGAATSSILNLYVGIGGNRRLPWSHVPDFSISKVEKAWQPR